MSSRYVYTDERDLFGGAIVYRTNDVWSDILVIDRRHYRTLTFDSIFEQSSMDLQRPHILVHEYMRAMMLVLAFIKPRHATILGLGGGCLLRSLCRILPACEIHTVELRQQVYEVASNFFGLPDSNKLKITIADAKRVLKYTGDISTDVIFADMYHAYGVNTFQLQKSFIDQCYRALNNAGWLVINYHDMPDLDTSFFKCLCSLFSDVFVCPVSSGNNILFASKHQIVEPPQFDSAVVALEKQLEVRLMPLFKRMVRLNAQYFS